MSLVLRVGVLVRRPTRVRRAKLRVPRAAEDSPGAVAVVDRRKGRIDAKNDIFDVVE